MEYRSKDYLESLSWPLLNCLMWVGAVGIAWNLLKPGGWLFRIIDLIVDNQPASFYYLGVGLLGLLAGKAWLDNIGPRAFSNLLTVIAAFAGTFFLLSLLLSL